MSKLIVEVCPVLEVNAHPNADRLEILRIKGWDVVAQKNLVKAGDHVVYFPPDSVLSEDLADRLNIRKYLAPVKKDGEVVGYRVMAARLRGVASYGTIDHLVPDGKGAGEDLADYFGVTKYEPPVKDVAGDQEPDHPLFHRYTNIENIRNYPNVLQEGEEVVLTEKLHGSNGRVGYIDTEPGLHMLRESGRPILMGGSHSVRRKEYDAAGKRSMYWKPVEDPKFVQMLDGLRPAGNVVVFFEIFGSGVQDMAYGHANGSKAYRVFDIAINGRYVDADEKEKWCRLFDVPMVPILYRGPFSWGVVESLTNGPTTMCKPEEAGKFKGREGVVITPVKERTDPSIGRVILKSISVDYLSRKNGTDSH